MESPVSRTETSVRDLLANSEASFAKRAIARYLFPNNAEKSVRRHKRLGTPLVRKTIMGTIGYPVRKVTNKFGNKWLTNYTMNARKGRMERAAEYATKQSLFNEAFHSVGVVAGLSRLLNELNTSALEHPTAVKFWFAINLGAAAVQRYNRARIVQFLDARLEHGKRFEEGYTNWLHLDNRSIDHLPEPTTDVDANVSQHLPVDSVAASVIEPIQDTAVKPLSDM